MKPQYQKILQYLAIGIICSFILEGCASFRDSDLPKYTYEQIVFLTAKPSIDYTATATSRLGSKKMATYYAKIDEVFEKSLMFQRFRQGRGQEKYHFDMIFNYAEIKSSVGTEITHLVLTSAFGLTGSLFPISVQEDFVLTIDVKNGEDSLKKYQYKQSATTWVQLFLIFLAPTHNPQQVYEDILDDMLLNFLYDVQKDRLLDTV